MFEFPFTVYVHTYSAGSNDGYGVAAATYTPAKNTTGTAISAFWAAPYSSEPRPIGHDRVVADVELFVPKGTAISAHDLVDLAANGSQQYEVIGDPQDYNHGPFGANDWPLLVNLRRVTG